MKDKMVKIMVYFKNQCAYVNTPTFYIINECYLLEFLSLLIREDIDRVEVQEYV